MTDQPPHKQPAPRPWLGQEIDDFCQQISHGFGQLSRAEQRASLARLVAENSYIHDQQCINLNPATNVPNPAAEAYQGAGLSNRPSLGAPGDKYEMGLEAMEKIELLTNLLACQVFNADFAEIRIGSGALANLYAFMATCQHGDTIIVPPDSVAGHVTHHQAGAAGLYGLNIISAQIDAANYTIDIDALAKQAQQHRPKLITIGGSLNLFPHPVAKIREIADSVGAKVLFDAAHLSGMIAGGRFQQPLQEGAHLMTMSAYKSLGGPASGLLLSNDAELAQRIDAIAFPGLTANFDAGNTAALSICLLDWLNHGSAYSAMMVDTATSLADALHQQGLPIYAAQKQFTQSHQFAVIANEFGGGQHAAKILRQANLLTCGIGLPGATVANDLNGLRLGTPEIARRGMTAQDMPVLADFIARALKSPDTADQLAAAVSEFRQQFASLHFIGE